MNGFITAQSLAYHTLGVRRFMAQLADEDVQDRLNEILRGGGPGRCCRILFANQRKFADFALQGGNNFLGASRADSDFFLFGRAGRRC